MYGTDNPCLAGEVTGDGVLKIQIGNLTDLYFMLVELEDVLTHVVDDVDDVHGVQLEFVRVRVVAFCVAVRAEDSEPRAPPCLRRCRCQAPRQPL